MTEFPTPAPAQAEQIVAILHPATVHAGTPKIAMLLDRGMVPCGVIFMDPATGRRAMLDHGAVSWFDGQLAGWPLAAGPWRATHRHVKRGSTYRIVGTARLQLTKPIGDMDELTIYAAENGSLWVRSTAEFNDGRFELIAPAAEADNG